MDERGNHGHHRRALGREGGARRSGPGRPQPLGDFPVTAGQSLTFQFWAKVAGGPSWAGVGVDFLNSSGAEISEINLQVTSTAYALRSVTQAVPAGAVNARIWTWKSGATGNLFLDDFCMTGPAPADTQAPSVPSGLASSAVTQTGFTLTWNASTDNVGVTGYQVFRNGTSVGTPTATSFAVTGLTAGTSHAMTVRARDAAGNWSAQSAALNVTTASATPSSCGALATAVSRAASPAGQRRQHVDLEQRPHRVRAPRPPDRRRAGCITGARSPWPPDRPWPSSVGQVSGAPSWAGIGSTTSTRRATEISEAVLTVTAAAYTEYSVYHGRAARAPRAQRLWTWKSGTAGTLLVDDVCLTVTGTAGDDTQAPSMPAGLAASNITIDELHLVVDGVSPTRGRDRLRGLPRRRLHRHAVRHDVQRDRADRVHRVRDAGARPGCRRQLVRAKCGL